MTLSPRPSRFSACNIPGESVRAVSRIVCESDKIARDYTKTRRSTPRPRACEITEATFSSESLVMANQTLSAYSLVAEGSKQVHALFIVKRSADSARARGYVRKSRIFLLRKCVIARTLSPGTEKLGVAWVQSTLCRP